MLVTIMHNNQEYLDCVAQLAAREGIKDLSFIKRRGIGTRLLGGDPSFIYCRGSRIEAYEKALVAVIESEEKVKHFIEAIEGDDYLDRLNMQKKGFICALPFNCARGPRLNSFAERR